MSWLNASLPLWIIGAPFIYAIVDWMRSPKSTGTVYASAPARTAAVR